MTNRGRIEPIIVDPWASEKDAEIEYGVRLTEINDVNDADCVIVAVAHKEFKELGLAGVIKLFKPREDSEKVLVDVKGLYSIDELKKSGILYWRL